MQTCKPKLQKNIFIADYGKWWSHDTSRNILGYTSMIVLSLFGIIGRYSTANTNTPNNTNLEYPLRQVSKLECRTTHWNDHSTDCKIWLPRIAGANFDAVKNNKTVRDIYSVLYKDAYTKTWQFVGSHMGIDFSTARGTPTYAIADGIVDFAGTQGWYGNVIKIRFRYNSKEYLAVYAHLDTIEVKQGDSVKKWQRIGTVGNTGVAWGQMGWFHLHFEINIPDPKSKRFVYGFWECPEWNMGKNEFQVVEQWHCRSFMDQRTLDPIAFLEQAWAAIVAPSPWWQDTVVQQPTPSQPTQAVAKWPATIRITEPQGINVSTTARELINTHTLAIDAPINNLAINEEGNISLKLINKTTNKAMVWLLTDALEIVSSDRSLTINPTSISLLSDPAIVRIKASTAGEKTVTVRINWQTRWTITFTIWWGTHASAQPTRFVCLYKAADRMKYFF